VRRVARLLWIGLALCCLTWLALILERNAARGRFTRAFSTYGSGPEGTRALYLMLGELGFRSARWSQDLARIPDGATLIALGACDAPALRGLSRYERDDLVAWVERGGLLIVAGARNYIPPALGVAFEDDRRCRLRAGAEPSEPLLPRTAPPVAGHGEPPSTPDEVLAALTEIAEGERSTFDESESREVLAVPLGGVLKGLPFVPFRRPSGLLADEKLDFQSLLIAPERSHGSPQLRPLALTYTRGRGRVIVLSAGNMLQNAELVAGEGAVLLTRLLRAYAPSDLLIFDEYHLGLGERRSLMQYLRQAGMYPLLAQLLLIACLALWRAGARLGSLRSAAEHNARPGSAVVVGALGRLYARVGDRRAAIRVIARSALARIAHHYALHTLPASALERELRQRGATHAADCVRSIAVIGSQPGDEALVTSVGRIDAATAAALQQPLAG
jgi:hypothetical protein